MKLEFLTGFSNWRVIKFRIPINSIKPINNDFRLRINFKMYTNIDPRSSIIEHVVSEF